MHYAAPSSSDNVVVGTWAADGQRAVDRLRLSASIGVESQRRQSTGCALRLVRSLTAANSLPPHNSCGERDRRSRHLLTPPRYRTYRAGEERRPHSCRGATGAGHEPEVHRGHTSLLQQPGTDELSAIESVDVIEVRRLPHGAPDKAVGCQQLRLARTLVFSLRFPLPLPLEFRSWWTSSCMIVRVGASARRALVRHRRVPSNTTGLPQVSGAVKDRTKSGDVFVRTYVDPEERRRIEGVLPAVGAQRVGSSGENVADEDPVLVRAGRPVGPGRDRAAHHGAEPVATEAVTWVLRLSQIRMIGAYSWGRVTPTV